jgi:hypothetical protein
MIPADAGSPREQAKLSAIIARTYTDQILGARQLGVAAKRSRRKVENPFTAGTTLAYSWQLGFDEGTKQ